MAKNDGGNVFPIWTPDMPVEGCSGMTRRQLYALVFASMYAGSWDHEMAVACQRALKWADALLAMEEE